MDNSIEKVVQHLIDQGKITEEELDRMIEEERINSPLLPIIEENEKLKKENEQIKKINSQLLDEDLNNKEAIFELYSFFMGGL